MKITDIVAQKKDSKRVNVFLDGEFAFGISAEILFEKRLKIGQSLSEKETASIVQADQAVRLLNKALRFLSYRPRSEKEIRDHLLRKGKLKDVEKSDTEKVEYEKSVDAVIKKLKNLGQINDKEFALWWVEQRGKFRPRGKMLVKLELLQKGVDKELIGELTQGTHETGATNELELAKKVALKKSVSYKKLEPADFKIKMGHFLARRGFTWDVIKKTVDSLVDKGVK